MNKLQKYNKFFVALLGAIVFTASTFYGDNQYVQMAVVFLTALGVYTVPNKRV